MEYALTPHKTFSIASIRYQGEPVVYAVISVDLHDSNSAQTRALHEMYAHALTAGCGKYTRSEFLDAINLLGAEIEVAVVNGELMIRVLCIAKQWCEVLKLLAVMLESPRFDVAELKRIRTLLVNELHEHKEAARDIAQEHLRNHFYKPTDRRYAASPDAIVRELKTVNAAALKSLHSDMHKRFWIATIAGSASAIRSFTDVITALREGVAIEHVRHAHALAAAKQKLILTNIPSKQNIEFSIGGPLPITIHHPQFLPFTFGLAVLGKWGGFTGRLMSTVREKEGLTYGIYARTENVRGDETGYWRIMTFFSPQQAKQGLTSTIREIRKIAESGITKEEHERFKTILATQQALLQDSVTGALLELHDFHCNGFTLEERAAFKEQLQNVTRAEVNTALATYLDPKTMTISGAGPITNAKKQLAGILK